MKIPFSEAFVDYLIKRSAATPYWHLEGYMERFWIMPYRYMRKHRNKPWHWHFWLPAVRLHHILRSDDDRHFHDHPWWFLTIILRGGYWEIKPVYHEGIYTGESRTWYGRGSIRFCRATTWHRLEIPEGVDTWTLFTTGRWRQKWGFLINPDFKMYSKEYFEREKTNNQTS